MKICAISDIHGYLPIIPECEVLCICGDIIPLDIQRDYESSLSWLRGPFQQWALRVPCQKIIFTWGNHDFIGHSLYKSFSNKKTQSLIFNEDVNEKIILLIDDEYVYNDIRFYGTPWCPDLSMWAFYKNSRDLKHSFSLIPEDVDVVITHASPKYDKIGVVCDSSNRNFGRDFGCSELQDSIIEKFKYQYKFTYILSGHIHSGDHDTVRCNNIIYKNVSLLNENYMVHYEPTIINVEKF